MAHFAELDKDNKVLKILVFDNNDVDANGGDQSEQAAEYIKSSFGTSKDGVKWVQTSYNDNFRKQYAGMGFTYNPTADVFIAPQPYPSWSLNETTWDWDAPVIYPTIVMMNDDRLGIYWDESGLVWLARDLTNDNEYTWNVDTLTWLPS
tara:strand:- start:214 stop:660 length:447 start_codon:yes stop_codon:yes gene_type:complete